MTSSESRKNNREADFVWAFVTVQKRQENGEWKDAEPGVHGSCKDKCTCLFCGKQFAAHANRIRAHIAQLKGQDVFLCPGVEKQPDETEQRFEERTQQFESAKTRCLSAAAEKEATRKKQKTEAMLNVATGVVTLMCNL